MAKKKQAPEQDNRPREYRIGFDRVQTLSVGNRVNIHGEDAEGNHRVLECTVASRAGRTFLTYRDGGDLKHCALREYPGKYYTIVI